MPKMKRPPLVDPEDWEGKEEEEEEESTEEDITGKQQSLHVYVQRQLMVYSIATCCTQHEPSYHTYKRQHTCILAYKSYMQQNCLSV